jgi:hypothetical protein
VRTSNRWYLGSIVFSLAGIAASVMGGREEKREADNDGKWREATEKKDDGPATDSK